MNRDNMQRVDRLYDLFRSPSKEYSPVATWWWSGDRLDLHRMKWQMDRMSAGGIHSLLIMNLAPAGPKSGSLPDDPRFFSPEWWAIFREVCAYARELDMRIFFYDQLGFSSANIQSGLIARAPHFSGQWLECVARDADGCAELVCPPEGDPLAAVAIPIDAEGQAVAPPIPVELDGRRLVWSSQGKHRLRLFYMARRAYDYMSPQACAMLFDTIHGAFERNAGEYLGSVIAGSFQDELEAMPTWCEGFAQEFRRRKDYDLLPVLSALFEGEDAASGQVRADYHSVRAELYEAAFFRPLSDWHRKYDMICGFDQHWPIRAGDPVESTRFFADYMRTHRWYGAPGSDHGGETKIHSSLAHLYNQPRVWMELFHSSGWGGTLEETFDWLLPKLRAGGTLYSPHAIYYSTHGGWWEWAPPSTCWRQPYWRHYPLFSQAITRLCATLSQGDHVCDVGLLYPSATIQDGLRLSGATAVAEAANRIYHRLAGLSDMVRQNITKGVLDDDRRDFDVLDDSSVQRAEVLDGTLNIGQEQYKAVVLPGCLVMEAATAALLCQFVETGGLLVAVGALPERLAGKSSRTDAIARLRSHFATGTAIQVDEPEAVPQALARLRRQVEAPLPSLLRRVNGRTVLFLPAAFPCATHFNPGRRGGYTFFADRYAKSIEITVHGLTTAPELWDPVSGERRQLSARFSGNAVTVQVPFGACPAALLVWPDSDVSEGNQSVTDTVDEMPPSVLCEFDGWWDTRLEQTMDNRDGDFDKPNYPGAPPVQTWTFEHRVESQGEDGLGAGWHREAVLGEWREVQATYGTYAWWVGPQAASDLPKPLEKLVDGTGLADTPEWKPAVYSLSRGIHRDPLHSHAFGSRGYVPEEFLRFGPVRPGQGVQCRTAVWMEKAQVLSLAVGAPAQKRVWVNGVEVASSHDGDLWLAPVSLSSGHNLIEIRLVADYPVRDLRAYWALVSQVEAFIRPEWMGAPDTPRQGSRIVFSKSVDIPFAVEGAKAHLSVATPLPCALLVNGVEVARQGGRARTQWHDIVGFRQNRNEITIETVDSGKGTEVVLDCVVFGTHGEQMQVISGGDWRVRRDKGERELVRLGRRTSLSLAVDPRSNALRRRPHPLPAAHWLEEQPAGASVVAITPDAFPEQNRVEWLRWVAPPGAISAQVPVAGTIRCFVDGAEVETKDGQFVLPASDGRPRLCAARIQPARGRTGGALLQGPVTYRVATGRMKPGNWADQGLAAHSGGVRYSTTFRVERLGGKMYWLDLGRVRGTAELWVNGRMVEARLWSPYRFHVTDYLEQGENSVEVLVLNTLAPYLKAVSPTPFVFPGQEVSGMLGPVRLLVR